MADGVSAAPAVGAGSPTLAGQQQQQTMAAPENFFIMCDQVQLENIKATGKQKLNILINSNADNFYKLPEGIGKADLSGKRPTAIAAALEDLTGHMLGLVIPGHVMILQKVDNLESVMFQATSDLNKILDQLTFYTEDHKRMTKSMKDMVDSKALSDQVNTNILKELKSEVCKSNEEIKKLRNELFLNKETNRGQRPENFAQQDQSQGDQDQGRGRGRGGRGGRGRGGRSRNYLGPNGSERHPYPERIPHIIGGGAAFDENCSSNRFFTDGNGRPPSQRREQAAKGPEMAAGANNIEEESGWSIDDPDPSNPRVNDYKSDQNKNKGNRPETVPLTKKQLRYAKELIIHKVPSQKEGTYKTEEEFKAKESEILFDLFEELSPTYLGDYGVVIDIEKDIDYSDRFMKHYDEINFGMAPIRLKFYTVKKCNQVQRACKRAECLKGRRPSFHGKFAIPRKYDRSGNLNTNWEEDAKNIASSRPLFYFRPSLPFEDRLTADQAAQARKEREDKKKDPDTIKFKEERKESLSHRVKFGGSRNFGKSEADTASEKAKKENEERLKEIKDKKAKIESERLEQMKLNEKNYPFTVPSNAFAGLFNGNNPNKDKVGVPLESTSSVLPGTNNPDQPCVEM